MQQLLNERVIRTQKEAEELCGSLGLKCACKTSNPDVAAFNVLLVFHNKTEAPKTNFQYLANGSIFELYEDSWIQVCRPLPNTREFRLKSGKQEDFNISMQKKKESLNKIVSEKDTYYVQKIFDGTVINMFYSKLMDGWVFSTRRSTNIMDIKWRGSSWAEILEQYMDYFSKFGDETETTFVFNISDTRVHFMVNKNSMELLSKNTEGKFDYQNLIATNAGEIIDTVSVTTCERYKKYEGSAIGYVVRFGDHEDLIIKSFVYNYVQNLIYKQPSNIPAEEFYKREFAIANSFMVDRLRSRKFFPSFKKYYQVMIMAEERIAIYLTDYVLGRDSADRFWELLLEKNRDAFDEILIYCIQLAFTFWTQKDKIDTFPKELSRRKIIVLKKPETNDSIEKVEVLETVEECLERIKKIPRETIKNSLHTFIKNYKCDFNIYYQLAILVTAYKD